MVPLLKLEPFLTLPHQPPLCQSVCLKACVFHIPDKVCKSQASLVSLTTLLSKLSLVSVYLPFFLLRKNFGLPGRIDILLRVKIFIKILHQGRWTGAPGSPSTFEKEFGWVLAQKLNVYASTPLPIVMFLSSPVAKVLGLGD